jgi:hypothetical protein
MTGRTSFHFIQDRTIQSCFHRRQNRRRLEREGRESKDETRNTHSSHDNKKQQANRFIIISLCIYCTVVGKQANTHIKRKARVIPGNNEFQFLCSTLSQLCGAKIIPTIASQFIAIVEASLEHCNYTAIDFTATATIHA